MGVVSLDEFKSLLADLGHDEFVAFVADLWAERGMDTTVSGNIVIGSREGDESVRVRVWHLGSFSWRNLPIAPSLITFWEDLSKIDVFVTNSDSDRLRRVAETADAGYVGPERLRTLLLYAIERKAARKLFRQYFDRPLETDGNTETALGPFRTAHDLERRLSRFVDPVLSETNSANTAIYVGLVAIAFVFVMSIVGLPGGISVVTGPEEATGGGGPLDGDGQLSSEHPPGINSSGLEDSSALVAAHTNALANRTYRLIMEHDGTRGLVVTRRRWEQSHQRVVRRTSDQYRYTVGGELTPKTVGTSSDTVLFGVEIRSSACTDWILENETTITADPCTLVMSNGTPSFAQATTQYLARYLDGQESTVRTVKEGNHILYRAVVTGAPSEMSIPMSNYTAVILVEESGFVREFSVTYETPLVDQSEPVSFSFRFEDA